MHLRAILGLFVYSPKWQISLHFHTVISRKVVGKGARDNAEILWVVLSSLFFKEIWKNETRGHGRMFASAKGKQQK